MRPVRVNADYEIELFQGRQGSSLLNQSLEFLAFFLTENPLFTTKNYSDEYLEHVSILTGRYPVISKKAPYVNWWGALSDLEHERWMNSKLTSMELDLSMGWGEGNAILKSADDLNHVEVQRPLLIKDAFGMSGRGLQTIRSNRELTSIRNFPCLLGPLLERTHDFSHYFFSDGKVIAYQNLVDDRFQYRGTLFRNRFNPTYQELGFKRKIPDDEWQKFIQALAQIKAHYTLRPLTGGFSVDSFIYREGQSHKIHFLCEVNYRRTMGQTAYELACRYAADKPWCLFLMARAENVNFKSLLNQVNSLPDVILLSPPDVRYQMFLLSAMSEEEGKDRFRRLQDLLPNCQFAVSVED